VPILPYEIKIGLDGKRYAIFRDTFAREDYDKLHPEHFAGFLVSCFGQYENAYQLKD